MLTRGQNRARGILTSGQHFPVLDQDKVRIGFSPGKQILTQDNIFLTSGQHFPVLGQDKVRIGFSLGNQILTQDNIFLS